MSILEVEDLGELRKVGGFGLTMDALRTVVGPAISSIEGIEVLNVAF